MEAIVAYVILVAALASALYLVYRRAYWAGYKAGATDVLNVWKQSVDELEDETA